METWNKKLPIEWNLSNEVTDEKYSYRWYEAIIFLCIWEKWLYFSKDVWFCLFSEIVKWDQSRIVYVKVTFKGKKGFGEVDYWHSWWAFLVVDCCQNQEKIKRMTLLHRSWPLKSVAHNHLNISVQQTLIDRHYPSFIKNWCHFSITIWKTNWYIFFAWVSCLTYSPDVNNLTKKIAAPQ